MKTKAICRPHLLPGPLNGVLSWLSVFDGDALLLCLFGETSQPRSPLISRRLFRFAGEGDPEKFPCKSHKSMPSRIYSLGALGSQDSWLILHRMIFRAFASHPRSMLAFIVLIRVCGKIKSDLSNCRCFDFAGFVLPYSLSKFPVCLVAFGIPDFFKGCILVVGQQTSLCWLMQHLLQGNLYNPSCMRW